MGFAVVVSTIGWAGMSESEACQWDGDCTCMIARYSNRLDGDLALAITSTSSKKLNCQLLQVYHHVVADNPIS